MKEWIVFSVGGSLIAPQSIDASALKEVTSILRKTSLKYNLIAIVGGGNLARESIKVLKENGISSTKELDMAGIAATRMNAEVLCLCCKVNEPLLLDPTIKPNANFVIGGGWKPGWSTDYVAVVAAITVGARRVINLTRQDFVYDKDPSSKDAKPLKVVSWDSMQKIVGTKRLPGMKWPFDPVACKAAKTHNLEVACIGRDAIREVDNYLEGRKFRGTKIN